MSPKPTMRLSTSIALYLYSFAILLLYIPVMLLSRVFNRNQEQFRNRFIPHLPQNFAIRRAAKTKSLLFFCSSAGEYEQAKPVIDRILAQHPDWFVCIVFFSISGFKFAQRRAESLPFLLSPVDTLWNWRKIMSIAQPDITIVVRHELWPAFLSAVRFIAASKLVLIDGAAPSKKRGFIHRFINARLIKNFDRVFVVDPSTRQYFSDNLRIAGEILETVGDTKFDRVIDRFENQQKNVQTLKHTLQTNFPGKYLIIGSAWPKDAEHALKAYVEIRKLPEFAAWKLILAPHIIEQPSLEEMESLCRSEGLSFQRFTKLQGAHTPSDVLVFDTMGILSEAYGCADLALVGGAFHHRVHNVLEPAGHGLAICFGPCYHTSPEARAMVEKGAATVVQNTGELQEWWIREGRENKKNVTTEFVKASSGASEKIATYLIGSLADAR